MFKSPTALTSAVELYAPFMAITALIVAIIGAVTGIVALAREVITF
jgi:hypothetical protein